MTTLGLTLASKLVRSSAPLAGQQFYIPPYLPDLPLSDFHLFGSLKGSLYTKFYNKGICSLVKRWEKAVWKAGDYIEK